MVVEGLTLPPLFDELLAAGRWPRDRNEASRSFVSQDCRRALRRIHLWPPPFRTYAGFAAQGWDDFYQRFGAVHELVPGCVIEIADFGHGSDSPILLDFQRDRTNPRVIYLHWQDRGDDNHWDELAPDFTQFVAMLGL